MPDDSLQDEERRLARRLASLPQLIPGAGPVPASPQEWAGYVENIRQRVQVRAQTKTNEAVLAHLATAGYSEQFGARELRRVVDQHIKGEIAARMVVRQIRPTDAVTLRVKGGVLTIEASAGSTR